MSRRTKIRSVLIVVTLAVLAGAAIGVAAVIQEGEEGSDRQQESGSVSSPSSSFSSSQSSEHSPSVPDVVGLSEAEAVKALGAAGLVANVRFAKEAPRTGVVLRSAPAAGSEVPASSVVGLFIALGPPLPTPEPEHEQDLHALGTLVEDNPSTFVGLYRDSRGVPHVVFGPGGDPATWDRRLRAAAGGTPYRSEKCSRDRESLKAIKDAIASKDWTANSSLPFSVDVHPSTCTVRVESDLLTPADIEALVDRFGTAISLDTTEGSHPVLLPLDE